MDDVVRASLEEVSVYRVRDRESARAFIGFKHINGPAKWDAYAKAKFAAEWYRAGQVDGVGLEEIAAAIGDRHDTVKRMVSAIYVLEQARENELFDIEDRTRAVQLFPPLHGFVSFPVHGVPGSGSGLGATRSEA